MSRPLATRIAGLAAGFAAAALAFLPFASPVRAQGVFTAENVVDGVINDDYCFDVDLNGVAIDNDFNRPGNVGANCDDAACNGAISSDGRMCVDEELNINNGFNYCSNGIDDDMDGAKDCSDTSCGRAFGNCGPCPTREDVNYRMCADGADADLDGQTDCADHADCWPTPATKDYRRLGTLGGNGDAAYCASAENDDITCGDGFDNDQNVLTDCQEASCNGRIGPQGGVCEYAAEVSCSDGADNDGDGFIDVVDSDCYAAPAWGGKPWDSFTCGVNPPFVPAPPTFPYPYVRVPTADYACLATADYSCVEVPAFLPSDPAGYEVTQPAASTATVTARVYGTVHESALGGTAYTDLVEIVGTGSYSNVTIVIGDATTTDKRYPYADATCTLTGQGAGQFEFAAEDEKAVQIFSVADPVGPFDLRLECPTPASALASQTYPYPVSVVSAHADGTREDGQVETDAPLHFFSTLYEAERPTLAAVQPEGQTIGQPFRVPYGAARRLRLVPDDTPKPPTLICRCSADIDVDPSVSVGPDCVTQPFTFPQNGNYSVRARIEDAAGNVSDLQYATLDVEVTPVNLPAEPFTLSPAREVIQVTTGSGGTQFVSLPSKEPFFRSQRMRALVSGGFVSGTGFTQTFCQAKIYRNDGSTSLQDPSGAVLVWSTGDTVSMASFLNHANCDGQLTIPDLADGEYFMTLSVTDSANNTGESDRRVFYVCNRPPRFGEPENVCSKADFDGDGAPEALYTKIFTGNTSPQVCDNCSGIYNPEQADYDANGIGNSCEADVNLGRCEVDRDTPCQNDDSRRLVSVDGLPDSAVCDPTADPLCCAQPSYKDVGDKEQCSAEFPIATLNPSDPDYLSKKIRCNDCCPAIRLEPHVLLPTESLGLPDSYPAKSKPQYCSYNWGLCAVGGQVCLGDFECGFCSDLKPDGSMAGCRNAQDCVDQDLPDATCGREAGIGRCDLDHDQACRTNADCGENAPCRGTCWGSDPAVVCESDAQCGGGKCSTVNYCDRLIPPWLQTDLGNLYSAQRVSARKFPPRGRFNATYCIAAKGSISNFRGEHCDLGNKTDPGYRYETPTRSKGFQTVLGRLDVAGLKDGRYGTVVPFVDAADLLNRIKSGPLAGRVYVYSPNGGPVDLHLSDATADVILNGDDVTSGAATIVVEGGDLYLETDFDYENAPVNPSSIASLASVAWVVLADPTDPAQGGNILINRRVTRSVGTFFSDGKTGITSVYPANQDIYRPLTVLGVMVAKVFHFERQFQSLEQGAEQVIYDGRAVANPPPGIADFAKALPRFGGISQ